MVDVFIKDDGYNYHDSLQAHLMKGIGHFRSLFLLAEERTEWKLK